MLNIAKLSHRYQQKIALEQITFQAEQGIIGLLGRNGAGKSTLLRILATLQQPSEGEIFYHDQASIENPKALRQATAYLPQNMVYPAKLSARDYIHYLLRLHGNSPKAGDEWLEKLGLGSVAHKTLGSYSGGMRQRMGLAYILACETPIILLDEPTQGLDPWERVRFHEYLAAATHDRLVLFSTHIVSDIEAIAHRILIIDQGKLVFDGHPQTLTTTSAEPTWQIEAELPIYGQGYTITNVRREIAGSVRMRGVGLPIPRGATRVATTLEDQYLRLTDQERIA
ncbi:ATP-binding cassette domain-containing protein [Herpetosiphon sp. NSE202]|uniref:ATP-binding cassette domain-containing protein n=1 Tax=Herpetosiphon sp. NSE202 TaxID=3351349 RepID=UPI00362633A1